MRISIRDDRGHRHTAVPVDTGHPPSVLHITNSGDPSTHAAQTKEVFLNWDRAIDDKGNLRKCPVCGCEELFARKSFPQITALVVLVFAGVTAIIFLGLHALTVSLIVLGLLAATDILIRVLGRWRLVCYGCGTEFSDLRVDPHHPRWNLTLADKYRSAVKHSPPPDDAPRQARKDN